MAGGKRPLVIRGGLLLDARGHRTVERDILVVGDEIKAVGPPGMAVPEAAAQRDADGFLIIPGFVNAHTHSHGALAKGAGDRWTLELLLNAGPWITGGQSPEDRYAGALLNAAEMIRRGATATYDLTWEFPAPTIPGLEATAQAYGDIGLRALVAPMLADINLFGAVPGLLEALPEALQRDVERVRLRPYVELIAACRSLLHGRAPAAELVRFGIAPTIPLFCSEDFLKACRALADDTGAFVHTHLAESKIQALSGMTRYGQTLTAYFDSLGLITERFTGAHGVWLDGDDMSRLGERGASVAVNPGSNLRLGSGIADARAMLSAGVNVAVGSDGSSSSDNQNMFEAARLTSYCSRVLSHDRERWLTTEETFEAATLGGAKSMGLEGVIGRIAPGYKADLVFLDLDDLAYIPINDPVNQLVHADDGGSVHSVMIAGRLVYDARRFTTIDLDKLRQGARRARERLDGISEERKALVGSLEGLVAQYCSCFAQQPYHVHRMGFCPLHEEGKAEKGP